MRISRSVRLPFCVLGAAAAGLLLPSLPAYGQSRNFVFSNTKKITKQTPSTTQPPQLLAVPEGTSSAPGQVTSQPGDKSEVQRQLEMLYEKDGREMPEMAVSSQPMTPLAKPGQNLPPAGSDVQQTQLQTRPAQSYSASSSARNPSTTARNYSVTPDSPIGTEPSAKPTRQGGIRGFFKKLLPSSRKKETSKAPEPPEESDLIPDVPPSSGGGTLPDFDSYPSIPPAPEALPQQPVLLPAPSGSRPLPLGRSQQTVQSMDELSDVPPLASAPAPLSSEVTEFDLPDDRDVDIVPDIDPPSKRITVRSSKEPIMESDPFSGASQPSDPGSADDFGNLPLPDDESDPFNADQSEEEDPFSVQEKPFLQPPMDAPVESKAVAPGDEAVPPRIAPPPSPLALPSAEVGRPAQDNPATEVPSIADPSESATEKMQLIRERFGMKGLKGFCPVTLRDQRELRDARPEFHATYRGQKFHFASAAARDRFETDPSLYAPAAYGADVVALAEDKDVVEGKLDYAAWYKGRLYLFSNQMNYDNFVRSPAKFAASKEIE